MFIRGVLSLCHTFAKILKYTNTNSHMNHLLLDVLDGRPVPRPPVWLMRQAGRILPQYRALRSGMKDFKSLVKHPSKAAEVTIQPVDELDVDAAILFSDILVVPEAMGLDYEMARTVGPIFPKTIQQPDDINRLDKGDEVIQRLDYVFSAIYEIKNRLNGRVPLIGFCGAPWTIFCYMLEGQGSKTFSTARRFIYTQPEAAHQLLEIIADISARYLTEQIKSGVDVVQIFDSWAGVLGHDMYMEFGIKYIRKILLNLPANSRSIVFAKGAHASIEALCDLPCTALGFDWLFSAEHIKAQVNGRKVIQGNLDPAVLYGNPELIQQRTLTLISSFEKDHILNLGHGVYPDTPLEGVRHFVDSAKSFRYESM